MRRFLGVSVEEVDIAGQWLSEIATKPKLVRRDEPPRAEADIFPMGLKSMPVLGFETEEEARRTEQAFLSLSGREATVLAYLAYGHSAKEVAHKLNLSCRTVDTFRTRALLKLRARNTADAVRMLASLSALAGLTPVREAAE
jgi:DNA-binding CsgD family transcriptional regulator